MFKPCELEGDGTDINPKYAERMKVYWAVTYKKKWDDYQQSQRRIPVEMNKLYDARRQYDDALCAFAEARPGVNREEDQRLKQRQKLGRVSVRAT